MSALDTTTLTIISLVLVCYLCGLLVIGWLAARRTHGGTDFYLANRSLGAWAAGISSTASSESGWVTLGAVGMTYTFGISGLWFAPGCLLGYLVNLYFVAPRLRRLSVTQNSVTLTDIISQRWGDPRHLVRIVSVAIIIVCMMGYVAAQMTATGKVFSSMMGWGEDLWRINLLGVEIRVGGYHLGVLLGAVAITIVTFMGGFRGVAWTDLFQGLLMVFALLAIPLFALVKLGGVTELKAGLAAVNPEFLTATGGRASAGVLGFVVGELGIGLGYPGMPHVITRYMATRDEQQIKRLRLIGMLWGVAVFYGAGLMGLVGRVMFPALEDGERTLIVASLELLHPVFAGLILAAILSAILSTVSSQLLVASSAVSYDVVEGVMGRVADDRRSLRLGRWCVVIVGLLAVLLALTEVRLVFWFVLFAWSGLGASFGPLILFSLTRWRVNRFGALACMWTGFGVTIAWKLGRGIQENPGAFQLVLPVALAVGAIALVAGWLSRRFDRGDHLAVLLATCFIILSWLLVQHFSLHELYELVPAFALSTTAALLVSFLAPDRRARATSTA